MKTDMVILFVLTLLMTGCRGRVLDTASQPSPMIGKMEAVTRHLHDLIKAMKELDRELKEALLTDRVSQRVNKRSSRYTEDGVNCRLSLREDICQAMEIMKERFNHLHTPTSPGKRSEEDPMRYYKLAEDLMKKRKMLQTLNNMFNDAGHIMDREKKWMTCNLNLGFTCQTQEYSAIADYYDFLNSAHSPGKKRSVPSLPDKS